MEVIGIVISTRANVVVIPITAVAIRVTERSGITFPAERLDGVESVVLRGLSGFNTGTAVLVGMEVFSIVIAAAANVVVVPVTAIPV